MKKTRLVALALFSMTFFVALGANAGSREACAAACKAEFDACVGEGGPSKAECLAELAACRSGC